MPQFTVQTGMGFFLLLGPGGINRRGLHASRRPAHLPHIYDQKRRAGEDPRGRVDVHQHFIGREEAEHGRHPDQAEHDRAENGENGRLERASHAAQRGAFDLVGGGQPLERADMPHTADREHGDRAARGVDADEEIVPDHENRAQDFGEHDAEQQAETEDPFASSDVARAEILTGEGDSSLREGIRDVVGEIFEVECER